MTDTLPAATDVLPGATVNRAEARILEDLVDRGISPRAILQRRHRTHIDALVRKGLVEHLETGVTLVDEVAALVALGRVCGDHDRPFPCLECAND